MSTLTPDDTGITTPAPQTPAQLELGLTTGDSTRAEPIDTNPPVPIGLQELMALGVKVELLGKAMQDATSTVDHLVALSAECGLAMHIEVIRDAPTEPDEAPES